MPEFAFFGRSNVGKSSLINMIVNRKSLVKTGSRPGMTRMINFFLINKIFCLADLPGYGYARRSAAENEAFNRMLAEYANTRKDLKALFFLLI
ncbi:GTP-binding protein [Brucepastera parasyntrophica]|uniref:GTP-binding protein n=1 Tax=Brucepastera parasyntrophica TaxID=2880008 RepID=UPI002109C0BE|nr:GTPase [Brucepastera parasyntrophica]